MLATHTIDSEDPTGGDSSERKPDAARSRGAVIWAVVGLALLCLLGLRVYGVIGPRPCTSCHDRGEFVAQTQASPHADVACRACHMSPGLAGDVVFALQRPLHAYIPSTRAANRDAAAVPDARCEACHEKALQGVVTSNGIRIKHSACAATALCTDCHSATAHGSATKWVRSYDMDVCLVCHLPSKNVSCDLCHEGRTAADRVKSAGFAVTHGPKWKSTHGLGDSTTCTVCHKPSDCAKCHGAGVPHESNFVGVHSAYASQADAQCSTCHKDAFCNACHGTKMPHPADFTERHPATSRLQPALCRRCHAPSDCEECHLRHVHPGGAVGAPASGGGQ